MENNSDLETINSFKILISNIKALKDKTWGCPWQKIQSHVSLIPFLYEEINEFIDAIYKKNADNICEELGDLLLQVMLHAEIGYEEKEFALNDVIKNLNKKIINSCLLYTSDAADDLTRVDLGGRRIIKKITTDLGKYKKFKKRCTSYGIID